MLQETLVVNSIAEINAHILVLSEMQLGETTFLFESGDFEWSGEINVPNVRTSVTLSVPRPTGLVTSVVLLLQSTRSIVNIALSPGCVVTLTERGSFKLRKGSQLHIHCPACSSPRQSVGQLQTSAPKTTPCCTRDGTTAGITTESVAFGQPLKPLPQVIAHGTSGFVVGRGTMLELTNIDLVHQFEADRYCTMFNCWSKIKQMVFGFK
jgi:hypothetical protein